MSVPLRMPAPTCPAPCASRNSPCHGCVRRYAISHVVRSRKTGQPRMHHALVIPKDRGVTIDGKAVFRDILMLVEFYQANPLAGDCLKKTCASMRTAAGQLCAALRNGTRTLWPRSPLTSITVSPLYPCSGADAVAEAEEPRLRDGATCGGAGRQAGGRVRDSVSRPACPRVAGKPLRDGRHRTGVCRGAW